MIDRQIDVVVIIFQLVSRVQLFVTSWAAACHVLLSFTIFRSLLKFMSIESLKTSELLILYHSFLLLPSIFPCIRILSKESVLCIRWPQYWSFSISPSSEYSGLKSFRIDCFDFLAVTGTAIDTIDCHRQRSELNLVLEKLFI